LVRTMASMAAGSSWSIPGGSRTGARRRGVDAGAPSPVRAPLPRRRGLSAGGGGGVRDDFGARPGLGARAGLGGEAGRGGGGGGGGGGPVGQAAQSGGEVLGGVGDLIEDAAVDEVA